MLKKIKIILIVLAVFAITVVAFAAYSRTDSEEPLKMALIPGAEALEEIAKYEPIADYLSDEIGMEIEFVQCTDYAAVVTALRTGSCDIARLGPFSYVLATEEANVSIIVRGVKSSTGKDAYYGLIITLPDSGITTLGDIIGKTFAFVDVASTSGYLIPSSMFLAANITPAEDFDIVFAGSHAAVIEAVANGQVDAGATCNNRVEDALEEGIIDENTLYIIETTGAIPTSPFVVRGSMDEDLKTQIQQAFLGMPEEICLQAIGAPSNYIVAKDSDYDFIRQVAETLGIEMGELD